MRGDAGHPLAGYVSGPAAATEATAVALLASLAGGAGGGRGRQWVYAGRRKSRYARLLTEAIDLDAVPRPLTGLLAAV